MNKIIIFLINLCLTTTALEYKLIKLDENTAFLGEWDDSNENFDFYGKDIISRNYFEYFKQFSIFEFTSNVLY